MAYLQPASKGKSMKIRHIFMSALIIAAILITCPAAQGGQPAKKPEGKVKPKYWLPYPGGVSHPVNQGFHGRWTHHDGNQNEYAIDFGGRPGAILCAARDGTVIRVTDSDNTDDKNMIMIQHEDDEVSVYAHNQKGSVKVTEGDEVRAGQVIAAIGKLFHLHFAVWLKYRGIPMGFKDVNRPNGEPREFTVCKSKNYLDKRRAGVRDPELLAKYSVQKLMDSAKKAMKKKKYSKAKKYLDRAMEHDGADDKIKKKITEALKVIETEAAATFKKAKSLVEKGKVADARKVLYRMMRYFKGTGPFEDARKLLRSLKAVSVEKKKIIHSPAKMLERAKELVEDKDYIKGMNLLENLSSLKSDIGKEAKKMLDGLNSSEEVKEAIAEIKRRQDIAMIKDRIENLLRYHEYEKALIQLELIIKKYPGTPAAKWAKAKIKLIEKRM
ncbi:MAG: M23 family metallopeptidase [Planctomycetota bacterium]|nr:MAG: M23 family metallopeptidase [Planctomycetota bacterium]